MKCTFKGCKKGFLPPEFPGLSRLSCPNCRGTGQETNPHSFTRKQFVQRAARYRSTILAHLRRGPKGQDTLADLLGAAEIEPVQSRLRELRSKGLITLKEGVYYIAKES